MTSHSTAPNPGQSQSAPRRSDGSVLVCFSHLRWTFDFRRPQHLMSRFAQAMRVIYWEEAEAAPPECEPALGVRICAETGVVVVTPSLPAALSGDAREEALRSLLHSFLEGEKGPVIRWYDAPAMLAFSRGLEAACTVYDCMAEPTPLEREMLAVADIVFTGEDGLFEGLRCRHPDVHPFPSSIDGDRGWDRIHARMTRLIRDAIGVPAAGPNIVRAPSRKRYDYLVVGAGLAGAVAAERLASQHDAHVLVIDRRSRLGGSGEERTGDFAVLAGSGEVLAYLSQFAVRRTSVRAAVGERRGGDRHGVVPLGSRAALLERMLDHPNIDVLLATDYRDIMGEVEAGHIVFSGPTDEYFGYRCDGLSRPGPTPGGEPPAHRPEDRLLFRRYQALAEANPNVTFVGRLAASLGCTIDQMVGRALDAFRRLDAERSALFAQSRGEAGTWIEAAE